MNAENWEYMSIAWYSVFPAEYKWNHRWYIWSLGPNEGSNEDHTPSATSCVRNGLIQRSAEYVPIPVMVVQS